MINEEKAREIANDAIYCYSDAYDAALEMAKWKDQQFDAKIKAEWADTQPKNPYHKYPEEEPPHFGDYIVVIKSQQFGRRWAFKCWYGNPTDPFDDNPSKEWLLEDDETVTHWMEIPEIKED